ncbi:hypothetical protein JW899_05170 [Candidatus Uhrbacteria bacterium]|nr:hypothetical protein [Candidatus Uhrbacteria bacterium]
MAEPLKISEPSPITASTLSLLVRRLSAAVSDKHGIFEVDIDSGNGQWKIIFQRIIK